MFAKEGKKRPYLEMFFGSIVSNYGFQAKQIALLEIQLSNTVEKDLIVLLQSTTLFSFQKLSYSAYIKRKWAVLNKSYFFSGKLLTILYN